MTEQLKEAITQETAAILIQGNILSDRPESPTFSLLFPITCILCLAEDRQGGVGRKTVLILSKLLISCNYSKRICYQILDNCINTI